MSRTHCAHSLVLGVSGRKLRSVKRKRSHLSDTSSHLPGQIECRGQRGVTQPCLEAIASYLQERREKGIAILLSGPADKYKCRSHAFLLTVNGTPELLVSDGFSSGYSGEGPRGLISAISLLETSGWEINEVRLGGELFERLCGGLVTWDGIERICKRRRRPLSHVFDYLPHESLDRDEMRRQWRDLPINIPLPLIDPRLLDIATRFWMDPDALLAKAYRRLEDVVRQRSGLTGANDHGAKLFSRAFGHDKSPLVWRVNDEESLCYATLFTATFMGFRNSRAHREPGFESEHGLVLELLQLNQLFVLEAQLVERQALPSPLANGQPESPKESQTAEAAVQVSKL